MNHSPEPWDYDCQLTHHDGGVPIHAHTIFDAEGRQICILPSNYPPDEGDGLDDKANGERIVACVNFCRQLPTDFLERHSVVHLADWENLADLPNFKGLIAIVKGAPPCPTKPKETKSTSTRTDSGNS